MQRTLLTILLVAVAVGLTIALASHRGETPGDAPAETQTPAVSPEQSAKTPEGTDTADTPPAEAEKPAEAAQAPADLPPVEGLHVVAVTQTQPEPTLGSTERDPEANPYVLEAKFTPWGGGIKHIKLSRYSTVVDEHIPYPVQEQAVYTTDTATGAASYLYPMAAYAVIVNDAKPIYVYGQRWAVDPAATNATNATFTLTLAGADDKPALRLIRTWTIDPERYDLHLTQQFENLTDKPMNVRLTQLGPVDPIIEGGYLGDRRKVVECYLQPLRSNAESRYLTTEDHRFTRANVLDQQSATIWPSGDETPGRELAWVAMTNRYFAAALHAEIDVDDKVVEPLQRQFNVVRRLTWGGSDPKNKSLALLLDSVPVAVAPAGKAKLQVALFAGPQDPALLKKDPAYTRINLGDLIEYSLGGFCAFCTFAWLADALLSFLSFFHWMLADWGLAIIALVAIVRGILHPLTKRSQVNMMKVGKQMQMLQPEIERLKTKYKGNSQKLNQEMMALYRERGVNPAAMGLGCLPMFLQMPIWFALYAMLFFAIELRQQPAFYNVFHHIGELFGANWMFLTDLSTQDKFIRLPEIGLGFATIDSINILPLLMGVVFFIQQKYTTQATPQMSDQAAAQQKMMKWMVMLFPIMLYKAPSGLNLYILTSTAVGIIESKRVRDHIKLMEDRGDFDPGSGAAGGKPKGPKPGGFLDRLTKAAEQRQREMLDQQKTGGKKRNKKRK
ncbi:membrane protein insertase YidC [Planctomycetales bacterium ZRK34]|nr:membrane protein insertase YidC [Planctomycetales bacterium ZRK34]